jgi:preprotein translocase subunit SecE
MVEQKKTEKLLKRTVRFIREVRMELKKVIWPTRQQLINNTLIVFVACILIGAIIWIADAGLGLLYTAVFGNI